MTSSWEGTALSLIHILHDEGRIFVLRPPEPVTVSSMEKDADKLFALYEQGYATAALSWDALVRYLEA